MENITAYLDKLRIHDEGLEYLSEATPSYFRDNCLTSWLKTLKNAVKFSPDSLSPLFSPFYVSDALDELSSLSEDIVNYIETNKEKNLYETLWTNFVLIYVYSYKSKWNDIFNNFSQAQKDYEISLTLARKLTQIILDQKENIEKALLVEGLRTDELLHVIFRSDFLLINELFNYGGFCAEQELYDKGIELLNEAERIFHEHESKDEKDIKNSESPILSRLDFLTHQKFPETIIKILKFKGFIHRETSEIEKGFLYSSVSSIKDFELNLTAHYRTSWSSEVIHLATFSIKKFKCFKTAHSYLLSATTALNSVPSDDREDCDEFSKTYAELAKAWVYFGIHLLEKSCADILELDEIDSTENLKKKITFSKFEKMSLGLEEAREFFNEEELLNIVNLPQFNIENHRDEDDELMQMPYKTAKSFEEAQQICSILKKWFRVSTNHYSLNSINPSDYIWLVNQHGDSYKFLINFDAEGERQEKLYEKRVKIFSKLRSELSNTRPEPDVIGKILSLFSESHMDFYKFKIRRLQKNFKINEHNKVTYYNEAFENFLHSVYAQTYILNHFKVNIGDPEKACFHDLDPIFTMRCAISGALLQSRFFFIHPFDEQARGFSVEAKKYCNFVVKYLDKHSELKEKFTAEYEEVAKMPRLIDEQVTRIRRNKLKELEKIVDEGISYILK